MTTANWIAVVSAAVAVVSALVAYWSKEQARKAAALAPRREAIDYLRRALEDVTGNHIHRDTIDNLQRAKRVAELVFKSFVDRIDRANSAAASLWGQSNNDSAMTALGDDLQALIADMNKEASLA